MILLVVSVDATLHSPVFSVLGNARLLPSLPARPQGILACALSQQQQPVDLKSCPGCHALCIPPPRPRTCWLALPLPSSHNATLVSLLNEAAALITQAAFGSCSHLALPL